jgi:predicted RNase H-like HicB family nuclease
MKEYTVVIEKDEDGYFVGSVPSLHGCHTQAKTLDQLMIRMKEAVLLCLETESETEDLRFVGIQKIAV